MSWITEYLKEPVTITPKGTMGDNGRYSFDGATVSAQARVADRKSIVRETGKDEIISDRDFWLEDTSTIAIGDKITWGTTDHEVMELSQPRDLAGNVVHTRIRTRIIR